MGWDKPSPTEPISTDVETSNEGWTGTAYSEPLCDTPGPGTEEKSLTLSPDYPIPTTSLQTPDFFLCSKNAELARIIGLSGKTDYEEGEFVNVLFENIYGIPVCEFGIVEATSDGLYKIKLVSGELDKKVIVTATSIFRAGLS